MTVNTIVLEDLKSIAGQAELFAPFAQQRILITGATGLIGSMLARLLVMADEMYNLKLKVICHIRNRRKAETVLGDLMASDTLHFVEGPLDCIYVDCDYIMHGASPTQSKFFVDHPVETIQTAIHSTDHLLAMAKRCKVKHMVYLSSMEQYGVPHESGQVMTEDRSGYLDHLNVRSSYSESKRLCECLCKSYAVQYQVPVTIARLAQTFGAGVPVDDNRVFMQFTKSALAHRDIVLHTKGDSMSNFCYLTDTLTAILILLIKGVPGEAYNVCHDQETRSIASIARLVAHHVGNDMSEVVFDIPEHIDSLGYAPTVHMFLSSKKLRSLGWSPTVTMADAYLRLAQYIDEELHK